MERKRKREMVSNAERYGRGFTVRWFSRLSQTSYILKFTQQDIQNREAQPRRQDLATATPESLWGTSDYRPLKGFGQRS